MRPATRPRAALLGALALLLPLWAPASAATDEGLSLVGTITVPGAVSAKVVEEAGRPRWLYVSSGSGFLVYDLTEPASPREVGRLPIPTFQNEDLDGTASLALLMDDVPVRAPDSPVGGQLVVVSTADKTRPTVLSHVSLPDGAGHTATCLQQCRWAYASGGATLAAVDLRDPTRPVAHRIPNPAATGAVHDVQQDDQGVVWIAGEGGGAAVAIHQITSLGARITTATARATPLAPVVLSTTGRAGSSAAVAHGILHGSLRPMAVRYSGGLRPGDVLLAAEEGTNTRCEDGGRFHTFDARGLRSGKPLVLLDSVAPREPTSSLTHGPGAGCSAHWFTQQGQLVVTAWYGAGVRLLDISNPRRVRQVGRYVPAEPRTWSAYWIRGTPYIYALDLYRGVDVLRATAHAGSPEVGDIARGTTLTGLLTRLGDKAWCGV